MRFMTRFSPLFAVVALIVPAFAEPAGSGVVQEIHAMEKQWNDARARADIATLDRILVDDWTVTHANGTTDTKSTYLADLKSGARKFAGPITEDEVSVRVYGDTAINSGPIPSRASGTASQSPSRRGSALSTGSGTGAG